MDAGTTTLKVPSAAVVTAWRRVRAGNFPLSRLTLRAAWPSGDPAATRPLTVTSAPARSGRGRAVRRPSRSRAVRVIVVRARVAVPAPFEPFDPLEPEPPAPPDPPVPPAPPLVGGGGVVPPPLAPVPPAWPSVPLLAAKAAGSEADTLPAASLALTSVATPCRSDGQPWPAGSVAA